jgi:Na+(H+)/acetate symporter ActP
VIPLVLALFWGRFRIAGAVVGVSLAVLLPVTVALLVPTVIYQVLERTAKAPKVALVLAGVLVVGALVVLVVVSV